MMLLRGLTRYITTDSYNIYNFPKDSGAGVQSSGIISYKSRLVRRKTAFIDRDIWEAD